MIKTFGIPFLFLFFMSHTFDIPKTEVDDAACINMYFNGPQVIGLTDRLISAHHAACHVLSLLRPLISS